jgi:hypothetical protein
MIRVRRASIAHQHIVLRDCGTQLVAESVPPNGIDGVEPCGARDVLLKDVAVARDRNDAEDLAAVARHCAERWHSPDRIRRQVATNRRLDWRRSGRQWVEDPRLCLGPNRQADRAE